MCAFCLLPLPSIPIPFLSHPLLLTFLSFFPLCGENSRFKQFFGLGKMNIVRVQFYILLFWSSHVLLCLNTLVTHTCRMRALAASSDSSQSFSIASHTCNIASCRTKHTSSCFLNNKSLSKWMLCVFEWAFESVRRAFHADMYRQRVNTLYIYMNGLPLLLFFPRNKRIFANSYLTNGISSHWTPHQLFHFKYAEWNSNILLFRNDSGNVHVNYKLELC